MIPTLIPTTEEKDGVQRFIYRSAFPITVRITPKERIMDITLTDEPIRGKELSAILNVFGFSRNLEIGTEQTNTAHIIFRQRLLLLDMTRDSVVRYAEDTTGEDSRMCCRYYIDDTADELLPYIEEAEKSPLTEKLVAHLGKALVTKGEVRPTNMVPGIACNKKGTISTFPMVWGYTVPGGKGPVFNARSETAAERPLFKEGWTTHRCVLPASYFFEWGIPAFDNETGAKLSKVKYAIQPKGATSTWLAGIYRIDECNGVKYPAFTILTKESTGDLSSFHDRMPVIINKDMISFWLSPTFNPSKVVQTSIKNLVLEEVS